MFFGEELNEIQLISRNWVYFTHFSTIFHVFGLVLVGKRMCIMGKGSPQVYVWVGIEIPEGYLCIFLLLLVCTFISTDI